MEQTHRSYVACYFETEQGRCPSAEFVDSLDPDAQRKFFARRQLLEQLGPRLPEPHAKRLGHGIYELRFSGREADFRMLYFFRWPPGDFHERIQETDPKDAPAGSCLGLAKTKYVLSDETEMKPAIRTVEAHLREKLKNPSFRELYELEEEKTKIVVLILKYRTRRHLTQRQLARQVGVSQQQISKIEQGDFSSLATIQRVLLALGHHVVVRAEPLPLRIRRVLRSAA